MATSLTELLPWSEPRRVHTKRGPRLLRKAMPTESFWQAWRAQSATMKNAGVGLSKNQQGEWEACWWLPDTEAERSIQASHATTADVEVPMPEGIQLYPFQRAGVAFALLRQNTLIADEMGLGKTPQSLAVINADATVTRALVVCPAMLKVNWQREAKRFLVRPFDVVILSGTKSAPIVSTRPTLVICNYDILSHWQEQLTAFAPDILIADEVHLAKNPKRQRSKALYSISAKRRLGLTGTPIVNRPAELHPIISWLDPQAWDPEKFFSYAKRFCDAHKVKIGRNKYAWDFTGASNLGELQDRLRAGLMVRRLKKDVLTELPQKIYQVIDLPRNGSSSAYDAEEDAYGEWERARAELGRARAEGREDLAELQDRVQVLFESMSTIRHQAAVAKIPAAIEHIESALDAEPGTKLLVFAHHRDVVEAIAANFGTAAVRLYGGDSDATRQAAVDRFQGDPTCTLMVASIKAAGVGLTLTASHHVIFVEMDWTPSAMDQASDRAHRIGQTADHVLIQYLVVDGTIDARLAHALVDKARVIDAALDGERPKAPAGLDGDPLKVEIEIPEDAAAPNAKLAELAAEVPDGYYAIESHGSNDLVFLRVDKPTEGRWAGYVFMSQIIGGQSPVRVPFGQVRAFLQRIKDAGPREAMALYGRELGICGRCGRHLTDDESRAIGLGPICRSF